MAYKMKGSSFYSSPLAQKKGKQEINDDGVYTEKKERNYNPKDNKGRSQNVNAKDYIIQDVSEVQENEKGKFVTGLDDGSFPNNSTSDTTYIPDAAKHYSGKKYKKGDHLDETDFEEGDLGTGYDFDKKKIRKSSTKKKKQ